MVASRRALLAACAALPALRGLDREPAAVFAERRRRLAEQAGGGVIVLLGYDRAEGQSGFTGFRQESNFYYLTGHDEPGAALAVVPRQRDSPYREILFLPPPSAFAARWDGPGMKPGEAAGLGFRDVRDASGLDRELRSLLQGRGKLLSVLPRPAGGATWTRVAAVARRVREAAGKREIRDLRGRLAAMRSVKSPGEVALIRKAVRATESAFRAAWEVTRDGSTEKAAAAALAGEALRAGCERLAFPPVAGSGANAAVIHYRRNRSALRAGDLFLIDAGGEYSRYAADLARTVPVSGKFSARQAVLYEAVLRARKATIAAARPGAVLGGPGRRTLQSIAERALSAAVPRGVDASLPHAIGHHVGLDVHDPAVPGRPLREGMVLAIEPGLYLPEEGLGVRVEDMIEITADGCRLMSRGLPVEAGDIERAVAGYSGGAR